jgi:hypothetical protein
MGDTPMARMTPMGIYGVRQKRPPSKTTDLHERVLVQARVTPELRAKAHKAAAALNVSMAVYLAELIKRDEVDENGRPSWNPTLVNRPERLDLEGAA